MIKEAAQATGGAALGLLGIVALSSSARLVLLLANSVGKIFAQVKSAMSDPDTSTPKVEEKSPWDLKQLLPYTEADWSTIFAQGLMNLVLATASMFLINRYSPSLVTEANKFLARCVPIQFTPDHIPLIKTFGY